jgi:hypothetical protein
VAVTNLVNATIGSPTVTVDSAAGLSKGMRISSGFPAAAQIVSISGTTITMSENATANLINSSRYWFGQEIYTPVNAVAGTGNSVRVIGVIPSYANSTDGDAAVGQWEVYYDESTKKVRVKP